MGLALFKAGSRVRIDNDIQGDLARSILGTGGMVVGRVSGCDDDGDKAYAVIPDRRKTAKVFWESELTKPKRK